MLPSFFFFNDTATTEIYTLSLHDALPICRVGLAAPAPWVPRRSRCPWAWRSEEHTSELQSHLNLVCRLLLEKKKTMRARASRADTFPTMRPWRRSPRVSGHVPRSARRHTA